MNVGILSFSFSFLHVTKNFHIMFMFGKTQKKKKKKKKNKEIKKTLKKKFKHYYYV
jgi:hypothetical protein